MRLIGDALGLDRPCAEVLSKLGESEFGKIVLVSMDTAYSCNPY